LDIDFTVGSFLRVPAEALGHLPRKMPPRGTTY
jgi:hypothetical protein